MNELGVASAFLAILACAPASAQKTVTEETNPRDEIVVTGSRLKADANSLQPIAIVSADDIAGSGALTAADLLNELPQFGNAFGATSQDFNTANRGFNVGTEFVNLRGLGAQRTLVLVDGRRHVGSDPGTGAVDLNAIPTAMIDRVEIVTGASSAVYGADAVSGVVNIVLKRRQDGTSATARTGVTGEGDGRETAVSLLHGGTLGERVRMVAAVEYSRRGGFLGRDRDWVVGDGSNTSYSSGAGSSAIDGGRFVTAGPGGVFTHPAPGARAVPFSPATPLYQRIFDRHLQVPVERAIGAASVDFDASDALQLSLGGTFARTKSRLQFEPQFFQFRANATPNQFDLGPIPGNAPGLAEFLRGSGAARLDPSAIQSRRFSEYGPRFAGIDRGLTRIVAAANGDLGRFSYSAYYQYGRVVTRQEDGPSVDRTKFYAGVNACAGSFALPDCAPIDVFGGTLSPGAIAFTLIPEVFSRIRNDQHVVSGFVASEPVEAAGVRVRGVLGAEYRHESTGARVHPSLRDRTNATRQISAPSGRFDVAEAFGELEARLLGERLTIVGAARLSDYSTIGQALTWNLSAGLRPAEALRLRASYGKATRAPNINELFAPVVSATATLDDPCANDRAPQDGIMDAGFAAPAACVEALGRGYVLGQPPNGTALGNRSGGNPALAAETGRSLTFGAVIAVPKWRSFSASVDYFDIKVSDVVGTLGAAQVVSRCYSDDPGRERFCDLVTRAEGASRTLTSVSTQLFNVAHERVRGIDARAQFAVPTKFGRVTAAVDYTRLLERSRREFEGAPTAQVTGRFDAMRDQGRLSVGLSRKVLALSYGARWLGPALKGTSAANRRATDDPAAPGDNSNRIGAYIYHDLHATIGAGGATQFAVGVKNLADTPPPLITEFSDAGIVGSAGVTAGGVYDVRGRFFWARVTHGF